MAIAKNEVTTRCDGSKVGEIHHELVVKISFATRVAYGSTRRHLRPSSR